MPELLYSSRFREYETIILGYTIDDVVILLLTRTFIYTFLRFKYSFKYSRISLKSKINDRKHNNKNDDGFN